MSRADRVRHLSEVISRARYDSSKSQEYVAAEIGVSKKTIQNWESGVSSPNFFQMLEFFVALGINATPYIQELVYSTDSRTVKPEDNEEKINNALEECIKNLDIRQKRILLYILHGKHNSDPNCVLEMMCADMHTPMSNRVNVARTVLDNYEMCERKNELVDTNHILPNIGLLELAVEAGKEAVMKGEKGYNINN